jgi:hypothetical protein
MDDTEGRSPDYYREKAAEIRQFARRAHSPEVIRELFGIADLFDRMAAHVERAVDPRHHQSCESTAN